MQRKSCRQRIMQISEFALHYRFVRFRVRTTKPESSREFTAMWAYMRFSDMFLNPVHDWTSIDMIAAWAPRKNVRTLSIGNLIIDIDLRRSTSKTELDLFLDYVIESAITVLLSFAPNTQTTYRLDTVKVILRGLITRIDVDLITKVK